MKQLLSFIFCCLPAYYTIAQTITLKVDKSCHVSMFLNKKELSSEDSMYALPIPPGSGIRLELVNDFDKKITVNIESLIRDDATQLKLENEYFVVDHSLSSNKNLTFSVAGKRAATFNKPFRIYFGCSDEAHRENTFARSFQPVIMSANSASNTSVTVATAASVLNTDEPAGNEEESRYNPGSAVYDALKLADSNHITEDQLKAIVQFYFPDKNITDVSEVADAVSDNAFLKAVITESYIDNHIQNTTKSQAGGDILSKLSLSSIGGLDVTAIADGLAKFLIKRAKEELSISFFQKLKKTLDSIPDLQTLFPATTNLLSSAGDNVYDYKKYIQNLRESFKTDIQTLDENLPGIIDNHPTLFDSNHYHALAASLRSGCYFVGELKRQVHPGDMLANYPLGFLENENKNWSGSVQTLQLLSASLRDTSSADSSYWVNIKYVRQMVNDKKALQVYFGLLYQQAINNYNKVPFENTTLVTVLDTLAVRYKKYDTYFNSYKLYIMRFAEKTDALNKMIKSYAKPENDSLAIELYKKYFDATVDMIDYTTQVGQLPFINNIRFIANLHDILSPYLNITHATSDLVIDINRKNYSSAINHTVYIYGTVRTAPSKMEAASLQTSSLVSSKSKPFKLTDKQAADSFAHAETALNKLVKYGGFMAAVSTAQNSDEVESAIEAFALPTGSSAIKRSSAFSVSVNAYAGLFYGIEKIRKFDTGNTKPNVYGVTAPIGVAASWGHSLFFIPTGKHEWSTSVYVSLIDLGAVAAFRFKDTATEQVPTIQLKDIFSPGAFLSIGIPKTPLSFNVGAQAGPNLRKVSDKTNDYSNNIYWRYSVSLCVDIPIFNLYTR